MSTAPVFFISTHSRVLSAPISLETSYIISVMRTAAFAPTGNAAVIVRKRRYAILYVIARQYLAERLFWNFKRLFFFPALRHARFRGNGGWPRHCRRTL